MKGILIFAAFVVAANGFEISEDLKTDGGNLISKTLADLIIKQITPLIHNVKGMKVPKFETKVPIKLPLPLPALADPIDFPSFKPPHINLPGEQLAVDGDFRICGPQLKGLANLNGVITITFYVLNGTAIIELQMEPPRLAIESVYKSDLNFTVPNYEFLFVGEGNLTAGFDKFFFNLTAEGKIPLLDHEPLSLDKLDVDLGFENFILDLEGGAINGNPFNLDTIPPLVKRVFAAIWNDDTRGGINENIRCMIDYAVHNCTLLDIVRGDACLNPIAEAPCGNGTFSPSLMEFFEQSTLLQEEEFCDAYTSTPKQTTLRSTLPSQSTTTKPDGSTDDSSSTSTDNTSPTLGTTTESGTGALFHTTTSTSAIGFAIVLLMLVK